MLVSWSCAMTKADQFRTNAHHCLRMADHPLNWEHKRTWLKMAETWLEMIAEPQRRSEKMFEKVIQGRGTQQGVSKSRY
jgi:hypothetical protein